MDLAAGHTNLLQGNVSLSFVPLEDMRGHTGLFSVRACRHNPKKSISTSKGANGASGLQFPACPTCHREGHRPGKQSTLLAALFKIEDTTVAGRN